MKITTSLAAALGATTAFASTLAPRATLPKITIRGNGMSNAAPTKSAYALNHSQLSGLAQNASTLKASIINLEVHQMLPIHSLIPPSANATLLSESSSTSQHPTS